MCLFLTLVSSGVCVLEHCALSEEKTELGDYSEANQSRVWSWELRAGKRWRDVFLGYREINQ